MKPRARVTDKERLDFLDRNPEAVKPWLNNLGWIHKSWPITDKSWHGTLRAALDAAMRAEARRGK